MRPLLFVFTAACSVLSAIIVSTALLAEAHATPVKSLDFSIHEEYTSTRALGMGNAFTAVADDHSALFYNPSMLAFRTDGQLRMFVRAGTDAESLRLFKEIKKLNNDTKGLPDTAKTQPYANLIESHYGDHFYYRIPTLGMAWVRPGWGIAFIPADLSLDLGVHRQIGPMLNVNMYLDSTVAFSYAKETHWFGKDSQTSWGATVKAVHRVYVGQSVSAGALADGQSVFDTRDANEGLTGDIDLGTTWKIPVKSGFFHYFQPTFAIVGRNLIDYGFTQNFHLIDKDSGQPPKLGRRFDFGSKWDMPRFWVFDPHLAIDIRNVGNENWTLKKGSHAGMEFYWKMFNWWKGHWAAGLNEGYWTAGFGARMAIFQLDLASFGEDVGTQSAPQESRRYMLEMALDF